MISKSINTACKGFLDSALVPTSSTLAMFLSVKVHVYAWTCFFSRYLHYFSVLCTGLMRNYIVYLVVLLGNVHCRRWNDLLICLLQVYLRCLTHPFLVNFSFARLVWLGYVYIILPWDVMEYSELVIVLFKEFSSQLFLKFSQYILWTSLCALQFSLC